MRLWIYIFIFLFTTAASSQTIQETIVEDQLFGIPSASYFLGQTLGNQNVSSRDGVISDFCSGYSGARVAMVLSSRITQDEAEQCIWSGARNVAEVFDRYRGYVYFNLESDPDALLEQYRIWTDPNLATESYDLQQFLNKDHRKLPDVLKTNAPETCTTGNQLACADGSYCCNGTCIPNDEDCD